MEKETLSLFCASLCVSSILVLSKMSGAPISWFWALSPIWFPIGVLLVVLVTATLILAVYDNR